MFGGSDDADDLPSSIGELIDDVTTRGDIVPPDVRKHTERQAVRAVRSDAGHRFESDGFDMETCEDAAHAVESAGFSESFWYTSPDVVDDIREWYDGRITDDEAGFEPAVMVANRHVRQAPDGVFDRDVMLLIGDGAVVPAPLSVSRVVVRNPDGVAVVRL
jgi:hypothetical protein